MNSELLFAKLSFHVQGLPTPYKDVTISSCALAEWLVAWDTRDQGAAVRTGLLLQLFGFADSAITAELEQDGTSE